MGDHTFRPLPPGAPAGDETGAAADRIALDLVGMLGLTAIGAGLVWLAPGPLGFSRDGVVAGLLGELPVTVPAALAVAVAAALNLVAGWTVIRALGGRGTSHQGHLGGGIDVRRLGLDDLLGAAVGAVVVDVALLYGLGWIGWFSWPLLAIVTVAVAVAGGLRARRGWRAAREPAGSIARELDELRPGLPSLLVAFVVVAWSGAIVLQLASPVVPFLDVLPNHVATVEHLRTFGSWSVLTTTSSPIYGPSRTFLGYTALLGTVTTLSTQPAALAVSAFILPELLLVAGAVVRFARAIGAGAGRSRMPGLWALVTFTLTESFARMADDRATVLVLPFALWALALVAERVRPPARPGAGQHESSVPRDPLVLGAALGAAILVHPVVGALTVATVVVVALVLPERTSGFVLPAALGASILALPQLATMVGVAAPTWIGLVTLPVAAGAAAGLARAPALLRLAVVAGRSVLTVAVMAGVIVAVPLAGGAVTALATMAGTLPVLLGLVVIGMVLAPRRAAHPVVIAGLAVGAAVSALVQLTPDTSMLLQSIHFELPKTLQYWLPVLLAFAAATSLEAIWERAWPRPVRAIALGIVLAVAVLPLRATTIDLLYLGEHRVSETLAIDLRYTERGYWTGYPNARTIVNGSRRAILDALRTEIGAGRLHADTPVLHVAANFQQWAATPLGVFDGVTETDVTPNAEVSIHTVGGRLHQFDELEALLAAAPPYVVLEPAGLPVETRARILAAGYRSIFVNRQGEIFVRA